MSDELTRPPQCDRCTHLERELEKSQNWANLFRADINACEKEHQILQAIRKAAEGEAAVHRAEAERARKWARAWKLKAKEEAAGHEPIRPNGTHAEPFDIDAYIDAECARDPEFKKWSEYYRAKHGVPRK